MRRGWCKRNLAGAVGTSLSMLAAAACGSNVAPSVCSPSSGTVINVHDGDTITLDDGNKVRYLLVDTPEIAADPAQSDCYGELAKQLNTELVLGKVVHLTYDLQNNNPDQCTDDFKRRLAYVTLGGRMVNRILLERGYASLCVIKHTGRTKDYVHQAEFTAIEAQARASHAGMWGVCPHPGGTCP